MDLIKELGPSIVFCLGAAIAFAILMKRLRRSTDGEPRTPRRFQSLQKEEAARDEESPEFLRWQVEMHEIARDMRAEIDSKMRALQTLTAHANQAAERLEAALKAERDRGDR